MTPGRSRRTAATWLDGLAWAGAAAGGFVLVTQATRRNKPMIVPVAQSLTPLLAASSTLAAVVGVSRRRPLLAIASAVGAVGLGRIVAPASRATSPRRDVSPDRVLVTVAHANLLFQNVRHAGAAATAVLATNADVLAMSEVTRHHERALLAAGGADSYPYRFGRSHWRSEGILLWSKLPLGDLRIEPMIRRPGIVATMESAAGPMRMVFAHPDPPTGRSGMRGWPASLRAIGAIGAGTDQPTLIVADLNASRWHPLFRELLGTGWRDAHEAVGRGLSPSWPTMGRVPPFIRLDHALVDDALDVVGVRDFSVPGSDHRGFVVTVALPLTPR